MTPHLGSDRGWTRGFLLAVAVYFAAQVALRLWLGGAYETDEAEMVAMTPGWQLVYGPQLPLYNWIQFALFEVFGRELFALSVLKQLLLAATGVFAFLAFRLWLPVRVAVAGAVALMLVPDIAWEAERATTHSNIMLAACLALLWAAGRLARHALQGRAGVVDALVLGLALAFGGLSKYNFWLVPMALLLAGLTLSQLRARILSPRGLGTLALALLVAVALLWLPFARLLTEAQVALSSTAKLRVGGGRFAGLPDVASGLVTLLILPALVALGLRLAGRGAPAPAPEGALFLRWLTRAAVIAAVLVAVGVVAASMGTVTSRWMLPVAVLAAPALVMAAARGPRAPAVVAGLAALVAVLVMAGLSYDRWKDEARRDVDFRTLPAIVEGIVPPNVPVAVEFYAAGNLLRWAPERRVKPLLPFVARDFGAGPVLFLLREDTPRDVATAIVQAGWPEGAGRILSEGSFALPYLSQSATMPFRWALVEMPEALK